MLVLTGALSWCSSALANTTVNVTGGCTLRDAVSYADGNSEPACAPGVASGTTTIKLPASASAYVVGSALIFTGSTVLDGAGASRTTVSGGGTVQVLGLAPGANVTIENVTITRGRSGTDAGNGVAGGGISNLGTLRLTDSTVDGNAASAGVTPEALSCPASCPATAGSNGGNGGDGGGIYNDGTLTITDSTISSNSAGAGGNGTGALRASGTYQGAGAAGGDGGSGGSGGGIYNAENATLTVIGSTIDHNEAGTGGSAGAGSDGAPTGSTAGGAAGQPGSGGSGGGIANNSFNGIGADPNQVWDSTIAANSAGTGGAGARGGLGEPSGGSSSSQDGGGGDGGGYVDLGFGGSELAEDTIEGNAAATGGTGSSVDGAGGGYGSISIYGSGLDFDTIADNTAPAGAVGGVYHDSAGNNYTGVEGSIVASNGPVNCSTSHVEAIPDGGPSGDIVYGDSTCPGTVGNPLLQPLAANGGSTETMALGLGSAALNFIAADTQYAAACSTYGLRAPAGVVETTDQRGVPRPTMGGQFCDAGAFQHAAPTIGTTIPTVESQTTARISGSVDPLLAAPDTQVTLVYGTSFHQVNGTTEVVGRTVPGPSISGGDSVHVNTLATGLNPGTAYHSQLTATNMYGTAYGPMVTIRTPAVEPIVVSGNPSLGPQTQLRLYNPNTRSVNVEAQITVGDGALTAGVKRSKSLVIASGHVTIPPRKYGNLRLKFSKRLLKYLRRHHKLKATLTLKLTVKAHGRTVVSRRITVRR